MTTSPSALRRDPAAAAGHGASRRGLRRGLRAARGAGRDRRRGLRRLLDVRQRLQLLDVREGWERELGSIEPSVHVPLGHLEASTASDIAPLDPSVPTVVYCAHGIRSLRGMQDPQGAAWIPRDAQPARRLMPPGTGERPLLRPDDRGLRQRRRRGHPGRPADDPRDRRPRADGGHRGHGAGHRGHHAMGPVADALIAAQVDSALGGFPGGRREDGPPSRPGAVRAVAWPLSRGTRPSPSSSTPSSPRRAGPASSRRRAPACCARRLFPLASLITPNWPEAAALTGLPVRTHAQAERAGARISPECGRPVLVKGGHASGGRCRDCLAMPGGVTVWFEGPRIATAQHPRHGLRPLRRDRLLARARRGPCRGRAPRPVLPPARPRARPRARLGPRPRARVLRDAVGSVRGEIPVRSPAGGFQGGDAGRFRDRRRSRSLP